MVMVAALGLLTGGLASGCGDDDKSMDPVVFGAAEPAATKLAISAPPGAVVPAGNWPSACKFITDGEITALLPQADRIERKPKKVSVVSILDKAQSGSAAEGGCSHSFWLKGATIEDVTASFEVTISAVADPELITAHHTAQLAKDRLRSDRQPIEDHADQFGPQHCYSWPYSYSFHVACRQGSLMFELTGYGYGEFPGVADGDLAAKGREWREKVLAPVARIVATKVP